MSNDKRGASLSPSSYREETTGDTRRVTRSTKPICRYCQKQISATDTAFPRKVACIKCKDEYHVECLGITSEYVLFKIESKAISWRCYECQETTFKIAEGIQTEIDGLGDSVKKLADQFYKLQNVTAAYESIAKELESRMESTARAQNERIEGLESKLNDMRDLPEIIQQLRAEIDELRQSKTTPPPASKSTNDDVFYLRSLQRKHNLVIKNVPTSNNENEATLKEIVTKIGAVCGVEVKQDHIKSVHRMKRQTKSGSTQPGKSTDCPILAKFSEKDDIKSTFFMKYIGLIGKKTPLTCQAIGAQSTKRIFIDHHLSPELSEIKWKAIALKKANLIQNVIARYNIIKIHVENVWHSINNEQRLYELFPHHRDLMTRKEDQEDQQQAMVTEELTSRHLTSIH